VSAVATILGLLLVVTFIANYLTTTLPQEMSVNDINHNLLVENEVGHLAALLSKLAASGRSGEQVSQPFVLGSQGLPPFAGPDGGAIGPAASGQSEKVSFALAGPFNPPSPGLPNSGHYSSKCSTSGEHKGKVTGISCTGSTSAVWNFSAGDGLHYNISGNGGLSSTANFTTNRSLISIGSVGGAIDRVYVLGSNDTVYLNATGGATIYVIVVGSYDTLTLAGKGGAGFNILLVGNHDAVSTSTAGGGAVKLVGYGKYDSFTGSGTGATVYYTGFSILHGSASACPYSNGGLTDTVAGTAGTVTYNDTSYSSSGHTGNASGWTYNYDQIGSSACPFVTQAVLASTSPAAGFSVALRNTYDPPAVAAYDFGAVAFAQYGGLPQLIDPPPISIAGSTATIWMPLFTTEMGIESGTGTATLSVERFAVTTETFPSGGFTLAGDRVTVKIASAFAGAWMAYFESNPTFAGDASCAPVGSAACSTTAPFTSNVAIGTITLTLSVTAVKVEIADFSVSLE
jgi:hypothetical protein